jgi:hypothetical protein
MKSCVGSGLIGEAADCQISGYVNEHNEERRESCA